ncbi:MAG TPA: biliverdin-producing heme oxygenase [Labilithrix sp.]|nr:biliverdin-producing heme oxygenase [Labilithrix sp.]
MKRVEVALSTMLRTGTAAVHSCAERLPFARALVSGRIGRCSYERLVESLYFVYAEMEAALERNRGHPALALLDFAELRRLRSLEEDLAYWVGPSWRTSASPSPATALYSARVRCAVEHDPILLVGHLYTRCLGDLSGGQLVGRAVERTFRLEEGRGAAFYRFAAIPDRTKFKEGYRARLDALPIDGRGADLIVAEAKEAFALTMQLFDELGATSSCADSSGKQPIRG